MKPIIFWPESAGGGLNFVGYNHAVNILKKAGGNLISPAFQPSLKCRLYCNIPWHHNPAELKKPGLPIIAYTMFEATKLPNSWRNFLNKHCRAILVPTVHCRDMFRISGVKVPIKIVSLGVDTDEFKYVPRDNYGETSFNYLWQGHNYDPHGRKGAGIVEKAFIELKQEGRLPASAKLFLKYRPHSQFPTEIDFLETGENIIHISMTISPAEIIKLYSKIDCCINTSRGEGFGFIPLEQMAMGRPVILTGWSYPFLNTEYNIPLKYDLKESPVKWCHKHISFGKWGFDFILNKWFHEQMLPWLMNEKANGDMEYGVDLKPVQSTKTIAKSIYNFICRLQKASGFFWKPYHKRHYIMFEHPGYDAEVDINDLKDKMELVFLSQNHHSEMGKAASMYALSNWGIERVQKEFNCAINELLKEGVI